MKRKKKQTSARLPLFSRTKETMMQQQISIQLRLVKHLLLCTSLLALIASPLVHCSITFNGIPAAFGDLDLNKRTDVVVIGDDGTRVDIHYQHQRQLPLVLNFSCKSDKPVVQVYLADIDSDGNPNLLPLLLVDQKGKDKVYHLMSLKVESLEPNPPFTSTKLSPNTAYSLALNSESNAANISNNSIAESLPLKREPPVANCEFTDLGVEMHSQPLLFDLDGDLRTDFMSLDRDNAVSVWKPPKPGSDQFQKMESKDWSFIGREYFAEPHSHAFIDINQDQVADVVLSSGGRIAYLYAHSDPSKSFREISKEFNLEDDKDDEYGQSSFVDMNADGRIDHVIPRCKKSTRKCDIIILYDNGRREEIFKFDNSTAGSEKYYDYRLEKHDFAHNYLFPITLRASDLDGDGYTDFVAVAKNVRERDSKSRVIYLRNIPQPEKGQDEPTLGARAMTRTFEIQEIPFDQPNQDIHLVTLFDINEDGKVDMLIGASENSNKPYDLNISAKMNTQMVDACFMKVLVTNGFCSAEAGSNGQAARGPLICFELSQNDGKKMQGCAGQLAQSSHFALQQPYVIFGLGQTPHFVETLNVSIPGFAPDHRVRTRVLEQIVPDAQVIIIPKQKDNPNSWDYKMFLAPMSDLVCSTLIALAVLCLLILFIIFILHRQEILEDAAEHEEYKRHWPESR